MCTWLMSHWNCGKGGHLNGSVNLPSRFNKFRYILVREKTIISKIEHGLLVGDGQESTFRICHDMPSIFRHFHILFFLWCIPDFHHLVQTFQPLNKASVCCHNSLFILLASYIW
jgi:hypothetical protein